MPLLLKLYSKNHYALRDNQGTRSKRIRILGIAFLFSLLFASTVALAHAETYAFILKWGSSGTGNGQFSYPYDVAIDGAGYVYVADTGNHRVQKFRVEPPLYNYVSVSAGNNGKVSLPSPPASKKELLTLLPTDMYVIGATVVTVAAIGVAVLVLRKLRPKRVPSPFFVAKWQSKEA